MLSKLNSLSFSDSLVTKMIYDVCILSNKRYYIFIYMIIKKNFIKKLFTLNCSISIDLSGVCVCVYPRLKLLDWTRHECLNNNILYRRIFTEQ